MKGVFFMFNKKKWLSMSIALSLGLTISYSAVPPQPVQAFNWGRAIGATAVTVAQQQQLEKQINYLDTNQLS